MTSPTLFDAATPQRGGLTVTQAATERDLALERVEQAAPPEWREAAYCFLANYLTEHPMMFTDDLWTAGLPVPPESRALGALFNRAAREGLMTKTDVYRPSVRSHLSPKVVWRSLLYRGDR